MVTVLLGTMTTITIQSMVTVNGTTGRGRTHPAWQPTLDELEQPVAVAAPDDDALDAAQVAALDSARAAGERAGEWLRGLAAERGVAPEWMRGQPNPLLGLADAVERVLGCLDPLDQDHRDRASGEIVEGMGGVPRLLREELRADGSILDGAFGGNRLSPAQNVAVLAVVVGPGRGAFA